jgi:hypothetical protein
VGSAVSLSGTTQVRPPRLFLKQTVDQVGSAVSLSGTTQVRPPRLFLKQTVDQVGSAVSLSGTTQVRPPRLFFKTKGLSEKPILVMLSEAKHLKINVETLRFGVTTFSWTAPRSLCRGRCKSPCELFLESVNSYLKERQQPLQIFLA